MKALSISLFMIADIDSPRGGYIRVRPQNLGEPCGIPSYRSRGMKNAKETKNLAQRINSLAHTCHFLAE